MHIKVHYRNQFGVNQYSDYEYDDSTTVQAFLKYYHKRYGDYDGITKIYNVEFYYGGMPRIIQYLIIDDSVRFAIPVQEALLSDYISTLSLSEIPIEEQYYNLGYAVSPDDINNLYIFLKFIMSSVLSGLVYDIAKIALKKLINKLYQRNIKNATNQKETIRQWIHSKKKWNKEEICKLLNCSNDEAILLLTAFGYLEEDSGMFYFSEEFYKKNNERFHQEKRQGS